MELYNPNVVANESATARYALKETPTLCDCGEPAVGGQVYCDHCLGWAMVALSTAQAILKKNTNMNMDLSTDLLVYAIEHEDEIKEWRHGKLNCNTSRTESA